MQTLSSHPLSTLPWDHRHGRVTANKQVRVRPVALIRIAFCHSQTSSGMAQRLRQMRSVAGAHVGLPQRDRSNDTCESLHIRQGNRRRKGGRGF